MKASPMARQVVGAVGRDFVVAVVAGLDQPSERSSAAGSQDGSGPMLAFVPLHALLVVEAATTATSRH